MIVFAINSATAQNSGSCGDNATWTFDTQTQTLTISGIGEMANYSYSSIPWKNIKANIKNVVINEGITNIGGCAFYDCRSLTFVTIPNSVTAIGSSAFYGCTSLTSVTIPNSVTTIGSSAFSGCEKLTSVTIPNSVTTIGRSAFYKCTSLTSVTIPNSVTAIEDGAFYKCTSLTSVTIPNSVTTIGNYAFYDCTSLENVYLYANPDNLTWEYDYNEFIKDPKKGTNCHVIADYFDKY